MAAAGVVGVVEVVGFAVVVDVAAAAGRLVQSV